jgi:hypothetical protein
MQVHNTDVVIVGGGAAGCYAGLNLHRGGAKTIIVCKGLVGKSGASIFAGNLVLGGRLLGNTEENARNTAEFLIKYHNQFLIDQSWARRCGQWIETRMSTTPSSRKQGFISGAITTATSSPVQARSAASPPTCRAIPACRSWICAASRSCGRKSPISRRPRSRHSCAGRTVRWARVRT